MVVQVVEMTEAGSGLWAHSMPEFQVGEHVGRVPQGLVGHAKVLEFIIAESPWWAVKKTNTMVQ